MPVAKCSALLLLASAWGWAAGNIWLGGTAKDPTDWHTPMNWSAKKVPAAGDNTDVLIPSTAELFPALSGDAEVGGSLRIAAKARLSLEGHNLTVGAGARDRVDGPDTAYSAKTPYGLVIERGGELNASAGTPMITIGLGGLVNEGTVSGSPMLRIAGTFHGFVLQPGDFRPSSLILASSPYPYPVTLEQDLTVAGAAELAGGELIVAKEATLAISGDLIFRGKAPGPACLTPHGQVRVEGTIRSEGAAWDLGHATGWVSLVGKGDQTLHAGGFLPPIKLQKPSGKVSVVGDLHCNGLFIAPGNVLSLATGPKLILGSPACEWRTDPADKSIVKTYHPHRSSRDLINQGTLLGSPDVSFVLNVNTGGKAFAVSGVYSFKRKATEPAEGEIVQPTAGLHAGDLSINRPDSRLAIKDEQLFLDGKPAALAAAPAKKPDELDAPLAADEKATLTRLRLAPVQPREADRAGLMNVAPFVKAVRSTPSVGMSLWNVVDGSPTTEASFRTGVGLAGSYELVFPKPVAVSMVRFLQGALFAFRSALVADTTGSGACDTLVAAALDGAPGAWRELAFPPVTVHRLRLQALEGQRGWEQSFPQLAELEVYAPKDAYAHAEQAAPLRRAEPVPGNARRFSVGPPVKVQWPAPRPEDRITKLITADLWMFGIQLDPAALPAKPLWDFEPCTRVIKDIQGLGADGVLLFVEAQMSAFWPSSNFRWQAKDKEAQPPKRDLLKELTDTLHAHGLKLYVIFLGRFMDCYIGPKDKDGWQTLLEEVAARGVDGISLCHDEAFYGIPNPDGKGRPKDDPVRLAFQKRFGPGADLPDSIWQDTVAYKRWVVYSYEELAERFRRYRDAVKKANPKCETFCIIGSHAVSANNRMTYCLAYDVIGHIADLDYLGTDYMEAETRVWAASARNRRAAMELFVPPSVREGIQAALQGARLIAWYRYNYIEMQKSADHRRRESAFLAALERWGVTRARTPRALAVLASRASEDWWDNDHGTNWLGWNPAAKQGFWTARLLNQFLNTHGYPYDLYYLDHPGDLKDIGQYKVLFLPFPYSVSKEALAVLRRAHAGQPAEAQAKAGGSRLLIAQRMGEVDEVGARYDRPALAELIQKGRDDGSVVYVPRNLVEWEVEPTFADEMTQLLDEALGDAKPLFLDRHGSSVEAYLAESDTRLSPGSGQREPAECREKFLTIINWQDGEADIEVGLALPEGSYKMLTLAASAPADERRGLLDGKEAVPAADLRRFAVKLDGRDVRLIYLLPADKPGF